MRIPRNETPPCPECDEPMTLRTSAHGQFYGCSNYPTCRGTRPYKGDDDPPEKKWKRRYE